MFSHNIYRNIHTRVIIIHDGRMLLGAPHSDEYGLRPYRCLPGGGLEPNESLYECGEREVLEETGLRVSARSIAFLREWIVPKMVSIEQMRPSLEAWGFNQRDAMPAHAYGLEVYLWAILCSRDPAAPAPEDGEGEPAEWIPLQQIEREPLFPSELRALARDLLDGRTVFGVPSFVTGLGTPDDKPDYAAFRQVQESTASD